jgi:pimeloyl-ACP methyl ester carboxylesterase
VADYAPLLGAFADAMAVDSFAIVGYSGGGPYALAVAHAFPDRVRAAAVVSGAGQVGEWATVRDFETSDWVLTQLALHAPLLARASLSLSAYSVRVAPGMSRRIAQIEMTASDRAVMAKFPTARAALAVFSESCRHGAHGVVDDYALLGKPWAFPVETIAVPVHCWHGTDDHVVPLHHAEELVRRVPGAQLTQWEGAGHLAIVDRFGEVLDLVTELERD